MYERLIEIFRLFVISVAVAILMFLVQPQLYSRKIIDLDYGSEGDFQNWIEHQYMEGAKLVFIVSLLSVILWYMIALKFGARIRNMPHLPIVQIWAGFSLFPIVSELIALQFINQNSKAFPSLLCFFTLDVLLLFWLTTAVTTPIIHFVVPGSFTLRRLLGDC